MTPIEIHEEGMNAYMAGVPANECPYTFNRSPFWESKDYTGFNAVRWKLDAWMAGWLEVQRRGENP